MKPSAALHHVVIVGAGFGGLTAIEQLAGAPVRITLVDQRNHHIFQPLLYQAATASLTPSDIAWPIRTLVRSRHEVMTLLEEVVGVQADSNRVVLKGGTTLAYDTLILATGARHAYFGHDDWESFAPGLKTIEDATAIRRRILLAFEHAELEPDRQVREALLTFVIVGGGPTGVELAGTIAELARDTLPRDFRRIETQKARVILIEAGPRILSNYAPDLSQYAQRSLEKIGIEIRLGSAVTDCRADGVMIGSEFLPARTLIWAAGVAASPAAQWLNAPADRAGRLQVNPDLTVPRHSNIFAIGDTIAINRADGSPVPGIAPAAKQEGAFVAKRIKQRLRGIPSDAPFRYHHQGDLAQIGKGRAVTDFGWIKLKGMLAWWLWGIVHIYFLIGLRTRLSVALSWLWNYARDSRSARLITQNDHEGET
ncbi:MAG TPA: NAD(P)/FAD-dependent oxidoreductase [Steroidobacteraceae bacterium]|jgi:NADH dehydrogenase